MEENEQRAQDVQGFLDQPGSLRALLRFRVLTEPFRRLKAGSLKGSSEPSEVQSWLQGTPPAVATCGAEGY